jgi:hypothetical protein
MRHSYCRTALERSMEKEKEKEKKKKRLYKKRLEGETIR